MGCIVPFDYPPHLAVATENSLVAGAVFQFFPSGSSAPHDPGAALPVTDLAGVPITTVVSSAAGLVPPVRQADHPSMLAVSGDYSSPVVSVQGLVDQANAALAAAQVAAQSAAAALAAAQQLADASGLPGGGSPGQALVRAAGGATSWGTPAMRAEQVSFAPTGMVAATDVQAAIAQAASLGGGSGGSVLTVRRRAGAYTVPSTRPAGVTLVLFAGTVAPVWSVLPGWLADADLLCLVLEAPDRAG